MTVETVKTGVTVETGVIVGIVTGVDVATRHRLTVHIAYTI